MEKTNRLLLGVRKRNNKRLLKKVVDYLMSDSYMFAPLVKSRSHRKIHFSSAPGMEIKEPVKGKDKKLLEKILDYMKSDSYLYASLIAPRPMSYSRKGSVRFVKKVTMEISKRTVTMEGNKPIIQSANVITEDKFFEDNVSCPGPLVQSEMLKNMLYSKCRTTSVSRMLDWQLNNLLVD